MKNKIIIGGIVGVLALGGATVIGFQNFGAAPKVTLTNPQKLTWDKPTTDAEWAEDVKAESFDIKSTGVLETMIEAHTSKLGREEKAFNRYKEMEAQGLDPVKVLYVEFKQQFKESYPDMKDSELDAEALNAATTKYNQELWSIEKLKQSVERMNKEVELRQKGFVVVDGEAEPLLGGINKPYATRTIND